jgi:predicted negative regulator of RcsB-dependent stress response
MDEHLPIVLIEVVLIFGGVLAFGWWQLHEIEVDRRKAAAERAAREAREQPAPQGDGGPAAVGPPADHAS